MNKRVPLSAVKSGRTPNSTVAPTLAVRQAIRPDDARIESEEIQTELAATAAHKMGLKFESPTTMTRNRVDRDRIKPQDRVPE